MVSHQNAHPVRISEIPGNYIGRVRRLLDAMLPRAEAHIEDREMECVARFWSAQSDASDCAKQIIQDRRAWARQREAQPSNPTPYAQFVARNGGGAAFKESAGQDAPAWALRIPSESGDLWFSKHAHELWTLEVADRARFETREDAGIALDMARTCVRPVAFHSAEIIRVICVVDGGR